MTARRESGWALPLALSLAAVVVLALLAVGSLLAGTQAATQREARRIHAVAAADAALAETLARLAQDRHFRGVSPRDFGGGTIASRVEAAGVDRVQVSATGSWRELAVRIDATVDLAGVPRVLQWRRSFGRR